MPITIRLWSCSYISESRDRNYSRLCYLPMAIGQPVRDRDGEGLDGGDLAFLVVASLLSKEYHEEMLKNPSWVLTAIPDRKPYADAGTAFLQERCGFPSKDWLRTARASLWVVFSLVAEFSSRTHEKPKTNNRNNGRQTSENLDSSCLKLWKICANGDLAQWVAAEAHLVSRRQSKIGGQGLYVSYRIVV